MDQVSETLPPVTAPCQECLNDPDRTGPFHSLAAVCYCPHNQAGAFLPILANGQQASSWHIQAPIDEKSFMVALLLMLTQNGDIEPNALDPNNNLEVDKTQLN